MRLIDYLFGNERKQGRRQRYVIGAGVDCLELRLNLSPVFSIGDGGTRTWTQAIGDGNVQLVDPNAGGALTVAETQFFTSQVGAGNFALAEPTATPDLPVAVEFPPIDDRSSLLLQWDPTPGADPDDLSVVAWEYVYDVDPDLTNAVVDFSIGPPVSFQAPPDPTLSSIWDTSFELIDANNNVRAWFQTMPLPGWSVESITANDPGPQGVFGSFTDFGPFDITQVVRIRLDAAAAASASFLPPPPDSVPGIAQWMPWDSLAVRLETPSVIDIDIDIKPGSDPSAVNLNNKGNVPVAILGSPTFDVTQVDVSSLEFGPNAAKPSHNGHFEDVNGDGFVDLVTHYRNTGISPGDTEATLQGQLLDGTAISGTSDIKVPPGAGGPKSAVAASVIESTAGDVNSDGLFTTDDLIAIFQAGEYEDGIAGNSTLEEGDFDGDGDFTTKDLLVVFQGGTFRPTAAIGSLGLGELESSDFEQGDKFRRDGQTPRIAGSLRQTLDEAVVENLFGSYQDSPTNQPNRL